MDFDSQIKLEHLLFKERRCRSCGQHKDLVTEFYLYRKSKPHLPSSYAYECKDCAVRRMVVSRIATTIFDRYEYPDW
jgi:hypothetical protein